MYGVSPKTIRDVWNGRTWVSVTSKLLNKEGLSSKLQATCDMFKQVHGFFEEVTLFLYFLDNRVVCKKMLFLLFEKPTYQDGFMRQRETKVESQKAIKKLSNPRNPAHIHSRRRQQLGHLRPVMLETTDRHPLLLPRSLRQPQQRISSRHRPNGHSKWPPPRLRDGRAT